MNAKLKQFLRYIAVNTAFAACLYYGFYEGVDGAKNIALFIGWGTVIVGLLMLLGMHGDRKKFAKLLYEKDWEPTSPFWFDALFDLCVVAVFAWYGHYVLAGFYIVSIHAGKEMRDCSKECTFDMLSGRDKNE